MSPEKLVRKNESNNVQSTNEQQKSVPEKELPHYRALLKEQGVEDIPEGNQFIAQEYNILLQEPVSLYTLMRIDQFDKAVPGNLHQRQGLSKDTLLLLSTESGGGADGIADADGRRISAYFGTGFGKGSNAERMPNSTGNFSPGVLLHEATHASEYNGLGAVVGREASRIINEAQAENRDAYISEYGSIQGSQKDINAGEVLTSITEQYADNPVRFAIDMQKVENEDERKLAMMLIAHRLLPDNALKIKAASEQLQRRNTSTLPPRVRIWARENLDMLVKRDVERIVTIMDSPETHTSQSIYKNSVELERQFEELRAERNAFMEEIEKEFDKEKPDMKKIELLEKKADATDERKANLWRKLEEESNQSLIAMKETLKNPALKENLQSMLIFFFENDFRPNLSRSVGQVLESREKDFLLESPEKVQALLSNNDIVTFMQILRDNAGVEFALQDLPDIQRLLLDNPNALDQLRQQGTQDQLFTLQSEAAFFNFNNNIEAFGIFLSTGTFPNKKTYQSYEHK